MMRLVPVQSHKEIIDMFDELKIWTATFLSNGLGKLTSGLLVLIAGIVAVRIIMTVLSRFLEASKMEKAAHTLIKSVARVVLYVLVGLMVADSLGIDMTGVIALASVLTLSVSLALQNALTNVFGGFTLLYTVPFHSGDYVDIGSDSGTVVEIGMTYTKLRTPDNKLISIPNSTVAAGNVVNYSTTGIRRVDMAVTAAYSEPSQRVIDALLQSVTHDKVMPDPAPEAVVDSYGENAVHYVLRVWTKAEDYWDVRNSVMLNLKNTFDAQGIKMVYPHVHLYTEE